MDNKLKFKTRLTAIQLIYQHLVSNENIDKIKDDFETHYRNKIVGEELYKFEFNINFLNNLIENIRKTFLRDLYKEIDKLIVFNRKFENWDTINKAIIIVAVSELRNSNKVKSKIILNEYINLSKSFVTLQETKLINSILDKLIYKKNSR